MMRTMHIDCSMGAAGDMLTAALLELLTAGERSSFVDVFNKAGIPGVVMEAEPSVKCGIRGTHVRMKVHGTKEDEHMHDHPHAHPSRRMGDIERIIGSLDVPEKIKTDIKNVYRIIADAESKAHGVPVSEVHFHEVGAMDAVADITAVCMLMDKIAPDRVTATPVNVGGGTVRSAHGILPVPAPATAIILEGIPSYPGDIKSELCTPTGAALLRYFASEYTEMPSMTIEAEGFGMGTKDFDRANCVRITLGRVE